MRLRLKPRDTKFFDLFSVAGTNIATATGVLREFVAAPTEDRDELARRMHELEHAGDDATHAIVEQLDRSFGLRIMRTLGRRIFHLTPAHGFAAEISASSVLYLTAFVFAAPVSTTHVVTSAIMGVGATKRRKAVRWSVAGDIAIGWVLTFPGAASVAALAYTVLNLL